MHLVISKAAKKKKDMGKDGIMSSLSHKNVTSRLGRFPSGTGWCVSVTVGLHPTVISLLCINFKG